MSLRCLHHLLFVGVMISVFCSGCGGANYPEKPGEGDDAPVMDNVPDPTP